MKSIIFLLAFLCTITCTSQNFDCSSETFTYQNLLNEEKMNESFDVWKDVLKNCPKENEVLYTDGIQILLYKIDNATIDEKEKVIRELLKLYDQYNKNFATSIPDFEVQKAMVLVNNKIDAKDEIYNLLDRGITTAFQNITDANAILTYFSMYSERFTNGDKKITSNLVLEKYTLVTTLLTQLQVATPENKDYTTAQNAINILIKDIATCEKLEDFYTKNFDNNKDNSEWITGSLLSLGTKCSAKPIFKTLAEKLYSLKVTTQSATFMALAALKQRKFPEAAIFYNEAAELQTNTAEKAKIFYNLATGLLVSDLPKSKEYLNKALNADPTMGKAYLFLAQLYANSSKDCGKTDFEKKAIFYLAIQTAIKTGIVEPRLKPTADKMVKDFATKALTAAEISKEKMNGKSITIGCWMNETITFPDKK